ncbi:MAG TPA: tetratricopeptide repeat protein [Syntrophales bacterium]|nr:tetratricopeptide repeat protein [Syntrophales bacterium]HOX94547.1 tetratricopeptide repeat protein [Syntrophales bacterium]HPI58293.1 tetratricopeptide repeat protein [Syntrophales bacterium]HPN26111.1 tetratricopeptide repeat protein [Syntrophales bacterium]HQM30488.1 tetratricopeptide repeat protein [Syntrophales bacterium]
MSYIDRALKKAQDDRPNRYGRYRGIISADFTPGDRGSKSLVLGLTVVIVVLVASTAFSLIAYYKGDAPLTANSPAGAHAYYHSKIESRQDVAAEAPSPSAVAEAHYQAALRRQQANKPAEAEMLYKKLLELEPGNYNAMNNLGVLYMSQKMNQEAIEVFDHIIALKGDSADPYYNLACLYAQTGNIPRSLWSLKVAVSMNKEFKEWAKEDRDLDKVRHTPGFKRICGK